MDQVFKLQLIKLVARRRTALLYIHVSTLHFSSKESLEEKSPLKLFLVSFLSDTTDVIREVPIIVTSHVSH